ncbi:hypothetical protein LF599_06825 [Pseudodesulfovibrio thermohalotolerans]|uniref:hypothetical protein n=1 Tax=Pseudodesulfovibrio thermohalotolerans TaxID=2880651 RepID=UPI002441DDA4|nr:hypothetical protein [Pseudodesulfovibrio thermohalotolerans]WFS63869.1 hypothetical protein LF599_06825 [Pseudodesulfovibrio thermohalotolerans]
MVRFLAQSDYLREVQRTFGGSGHFDFMELLIRMLSVVLPMIAVYVLWRYRLLIQLVVGRWAARLFRRRKRRAVENYLVSKGVAIEVCMYSGGGVGRKLCDARVTSVTGGRMQLQLLNARPTLINLKHQQVVCFVRPFAYSGKRINAFTTLVAHVAKRGVVLKELSLFTPVRYRFILRRRHPRQRVVHEGAVRVKAWSAKKARTFWLFRPDMQTVNNPARYDSRTRLAVENISAGGLRLFIVNPKGGLPPLDRGSQLVLRVSVWNPKTRKYSFFTAMGIVRSRFSGRRGAIGLGIQFMAEGKKKGNRYTWRTVHGEIPALAQFLAGLDE